MRRYFFLFLLILILSGCRKNFIISKIEIRGIKHSNRTMIKNILMQLQGKNLLFSRSRNIINKIKNIDFVKNVEYQKTVPNILKINIIEYRILGYFTQKDQNFLILENGKIIRSALKLGIRFRLNKMNSSIMQHYLKFLNTKLENLNKIKSITINNNYNTIYLKDGFILKVDRNLNGLKNLAYKKIIKKYMHDKIKGFDLRYKDMIILILEA